MITTLEFKTFSDVFNTWIEKENIKNKNIECITYKKNNPYFPTMDDWATATKDDYYIENTHYKSVDIEELKEYLEPIWLEEIGLAGVMEAEYDNRFIYEESKSLFNRYFNYYIQSQILETDLDKE